MSRGGDETAAPGAIEDKRGEKDKQPGPPSMVQAGLKRPSLIFRYNINQLEGRQGRVFCGFGVGREGFVTPAGIGVSVPPRDKPLPSSLPFKLGTKCVCVFPHIFCFILFLLEILFSLFFVV